MSWACDRCRTVHTQNPAECRACGHEIFEPVSAHDVGRRSKGIDEPDALDGADVQTMGTTPDPDYESSPDVADDGSVAAETDEETGPATQEGVGWFRSAYNTLRGTIRAPVALLRRYLLPLLAFALVFGAAVYLLV